MIRIMTYNEKIIKLMPETLDSNFTRLSKDLRKLYAECV